MQAQTPRGPRQSGFADRARFLKTLVASPRLTGAVAPSGRALARAMAAAAGSPAHGLIVELGPGTGPVTRALIATGLPPERLVLVEYDAGFCGLLKQRFPLASVVQGDAYDLPRTLAPLAGEPIAAIVSSLPLLNQPPARRAKLIADAFALMGPSGLFVQFTYGLKSPVPHGAGGHLYSAVRSRPILLNLPPAFVWAYRLARRDSDAAKSR